MGKFVVKLAQPGIDVVSAGDENLVYNSNWPLLKIYKQGSFTTTDKVTQQQLIVNHDLGYVPMFWCFSNNAFSDVYTNAGVLDNRAEFGFPIDGFPTMSKDKFVYSFFVGSATIQKLYYYIFALDITTFYQAPVIKSGGVIGPRNKKTVFKLAKEGFSTDDSDLENYVVNSLARSPMIHAVYPGIVGLDSSIPGGSGFTYYHNLGYVPMFFAYGIAGPRGVVFPTSGFEGWEAMTTDGTGVSGFTVDEQKIQYKNQNPGLKVSLVVLKDPFNVAYSVKVSV